MTKTDKKILDYLERAKKISEESMVGIYGRDREGYRLWATEALIGIAQMIQLEELNESKTSKK